MPLSNSRLPSPAYAILYHTVVVLLKEKPRKYSQLKKLVNDAGMLPDLLLRMMDAGDVAITRLEDRTLHECSHISLI